MRTTRICGTLLLMVAAVALSVYAQDSGDTKAGQKTETAPYRVGDGVSAPTVISSPDPKYPKSGTKDKLQGTVVLWLVVDRDGMPQNIKVQRSLREDFDAEAIKAVEKWRFHPSMKDGHPVAVQINVEVNFRMH